MALSPEDLAMLKESGLIDEAAEAHYRAVQARGAVREARRQAVRAARSRAAVQTREAQLRAVVDKAVCEALARPEFGQAVDRLTESVQPEAAPPEAPERPLHEMTLEEWRAHSRSYWDGRQAAPYRPMTIGELMAGRYDGDEA